MPNLLLIKKLPRENEEKSMLKYATQKAKKKISERAVQRKMYERRKRAKAVNLELLSSGRSSVGQREKWWQELEGREIKKFGKIQGSR